MKIVYYIHNQLSKKKESSVYKIIKKYKLNLTHLHILKCKMFVTFLKSKEV